MGGQAQDTHPPPTPRPPRLWGHYGLPVFSSHSIHSAKPRGMGSAFSMEFAPVLGYCPSTTLSSSKVISKERPSPLASSELAFLHSEPQSFLQGTIKRLALQGQFMTLSGSRAGAAPDPAGSPRELDCSLIRRPRKAERLAFLSHNQRQCVAADVSHSQARKHSKDVSPSGCQGLLIATRGREQNEFSNSKYPNSQTLLGYSYL